MSPGIKCGCYVVDEPLWLSTYEALVSTFSPVVDFCYTLCMQILTSIASKPKLLTVLYCTIASSRDRGN